MTWSINLLNINCNIHALISKSNNIYHNCTGSPSLCASPMWPNIMNINDCNAWQLSATRCGNRIQLLFPRSHVIGKFVIWFTVDIICFAFETYHWYLWGYGYGTFVRFTLLQITCMKCRYCYSGKIDTRVIFSQSIDPPTKHICAWFIQID